MTLDHLGAEALELFILAQAGEGVTVQCGGIGEPFVHGGVQGLQGFLAPGFPLPGVRRRDLHPHARIVGADLGAEGEHEGGAVIFLFFEVRLGQVEHHLPQVGVEDPLGGQALLEIV